MSAGGDGTFHSQDQ